ncbi:cobalt-precorrin-3B C(17)-methyltransferase, partial [bacterium]
MRAGRNTGSGQKSKADHTKAGNERSYGGSRRGYLGIIGIGPGNPDQMSIKARRTIEEAEVVVGYKTYIELIRPLLEGKEVLSSGMTKEVDRSRTAIDRALAGDRVVVVSSGDPGVYGMAGIVLELLEKEGLTGQIDVEVIPGITSATAAAASLGAPLMHDFAVISLSDLLTP